MEQTAVNENTNGIEVDAAMGGEYDVIAEAIALCGGEDSSGLRRHLYAIWQTEITNEAKRKQGDPWTPQGSHAVQRTILACGKNVEDHPELVEQVGEIVRREIEGLKGGL